MPLRGPCAPFALAALLLAACRGEPPVAARPDAAEAPRPAKPLPAWASGPCDTTLVITETAASVGGARLELHDLDTSLGLARPLGSGADAPRACVGATDGTPLWRLRGGVLHLDPSLRLPGLRAFVGAALPDKPDEILVVDLAIPPADAVPIAVRGKRVARGPAGNVATTALDAQALAPLRSDAGAGLAFDEGSTVGDALRVLQVLGRAEPVWVSATGTSVWPGDTVDRRAWCDVLQAAARGVPSRWQALRGDRIDKSASAEAWASKSVLPGAGACRIVARKDRSGSWYCRWDGLDCRVAAALRRHLGAPTEACLGPDWTGAELTPTLPGQAVHGWANAAGAGAVTLTLTPPGAGGRCAVVLEMTTES